MRSYREVIRKVLTILITRLPKTLNAVYLHGSAVSHRGLQVHSDIDFLAVINTPLTIEEKENLISDLLQISGHYPHDSEGRRPIELIVFSREALSSSIYPVQCELIYGEWLREEYEQGNVPQTPISDVEFTLVLAQASQEATLLWAQEETMILPSIPKTIVIQSIKALLPDLISGLNGDERNVLLTLARMYHTLETGAFASKDAAAAWAIKRLPIIQANSLQQARNFYLNGGKESWADCQSKLLLTVDFLKERILKASEQYK